ncbi:MAG: pilus assembly protein [Verrucomicrobia bacterium]|nr:MAG: pilus assembly protein [Verrucomicrobiota bacterium]PYL78591.1 MAG: pilus assembly protein [Verrucomicrobiota bacterium]
MSDILIDTGPLVAVMCAGDRDHAWTVERFRALHPPFLTCEAVIAEACYLIERRGVSGAVILEKIENGLLRIALEIEDHLAALRKLMTRYASVPMSLADSCLVRMSEIYPECHVFTLDSDFRVYRRNGRQMIPTIAPER